MIDSITQWYLLFFLIKQGSSFVFMAMCMAEPLCYYLLLRYVSIHQTFLIAALHYQDVETRLVTFNNCMSLTTTL